MASTALMIVGIAFIAISAVAYFKVLPKEIHSRLKYHLGAAYLFIQMILAFLGFACVSLSFI